jgi:hypothetical protein
MSYEWKVLGANDLFAALSPEVKTVWLRNLCETRSIFSVLGFFLSGMTLACRDETLPPESCHS